MFETYARHMPDTQLINATEGGAHIEGFAERPLAEVLRELPARPRPPIPAEPVMRLDRIRAALDAELTVTRSVIDLARRARDGEAATLETLASTVKQGGLLEAYCWPTMQAVIADPDAGTADLCARLGQDAAHTAQLIEKAQESLR